MPGSGLIRGYKVEVKILETKEVFNEVALPSEAATGIEARKLIVKRVKEQFPDLHVRSQPAVTLATAPIPSTNIFW